MTEPLVPGELRPRDGSIPLNEGRETTTLRVGNGGDRPIQVGSHFHFFEANAALQFDRPSAFGMRLNIPAGTAVRFEPGDEKTVDLVEIGGERHVHGMNGLTNGPIDDDDALDRALERARERGFVGDGSDGDGSSQSGGSE